MSLKIRMARAGAKKRPFFHIVVADSRSPRDGRFIEKIGTYNPMLAKDSPERVKIDEDRVKHWLSVGACPSDRIARFLHAKGLGEKVTWREQPKKSAPRPKTVERMKAAEEAAKSAAPAEAPADAAPAEAPAAG